MIGTFAYLIFNTARNKIRSIARRLRSPRYAIGFLLGLGYFWLVFGRPFNSSARNAAPSIASLSTIQTGMSVMLFVVFCGIWLFGGDTMILAFSEAEVALLFPSPVSRRALILYKLARAQLPILLNVAVWSVILRRGTLQLPVPFTAAGIWIVFTTLMLHRVGGALVRAGTVENLAARRVKRAIGVMLVFSILAGVVFALIISPLASLHADSPSDPAEMLKAAVKFMRSPGIQVILFPFNILIAPVYAPTIGDWAKAMVPALGIFGLHLLWVLRADARFEEAAAAASATLAKRLEAMRARRNPTLASEAPRKAQRRTIALAPTGFPAVAIAWKNVLQFRNVVKPLAILRIPALAIGLAGYIGWKTGHFGQAMVGASLVMALLIPFGVNMTVRSDLRTDMLHLPLLKSLPIAGGDLVLMEVLSSAIPMAVLQVLFVAVAAATLLFGPQAPPVAPGALAAAVVMTPIVCVVLCTAYCTILNGTAVLFPAWIQLGQPGTGGVEMMGQMILTSFANVLAIALLLIIPAGVGGAAWYGLQAYPPIATGVSLLLGCVALASECYGIMLALGQAFERAEPQQVA